MLLTEEDPFYRHSIREAVKEWRPQWNKAAVEEIQRIRSFGLRQSLTDCRKIFEWHDNIKNDYHICSRYFETMEIISPYDLRYVGDQKSSEFYEALCSKSGIYRSFMLIFVPVLVEALFQLLKGNHTDPKEATERVRSAIHTYVIDRIICLGREREKLTDRFYMVVYGLLDNLYATERELQARLTWTPAT